MSWPEHADGDVFRRLEARGFDFEREHVVDYNVDFGSWPPPQVAVDLLRAAFADLSIVEPHHDFGGYVQFRERARLSYPRVIEVQEFVTAAMAPYGGVCESWGVVQDAPAKR